MLHDRYEILERLGAGGMARVYKARDTRLGRVVALKKIHEELADQDQLLTRFQREAQVVAQLNHPHIVELHDILELESGGMVMVMEYVEGVDLSGAIEGQPPLSPDLAITLLRPVADALAEAHAADIVHRDIKPANILIGVDGRLKLSDFGIAKMLEETQLTRTGGFLGTPAYIAPEQARGEPVGPGCDQYALATVLYELVTGRAPFSGPNALALLNNILKGHYDDPRRHNPLVTEEMAAFIARGMNIDPQARFPSMAAFGEAMDRLTPTLPPAQQRKVIALMCEGSVAAREALDGLLKEGRPLREARPEPRASSQNQVVTAPGDEPLDLKPTRTPVWLFAGIGAALLALLALVLSSTMGASDDAADATLITATARPGQGPEVQVPDQGAPVIAEVVPPLADASVEAPTARPKPDAGAAAVRAEPPKPEARRDARRAPTRSRRRASRPRPEDAPPTAAGPTGPADPTPPKPPPERPKPAASKGKGQLALFTNPWANVYIDGKHRGRTPYLKEVSLSAGSHVLELRNPGKGVHTETLRIKAGATLTRRVRLPDP